MNTDEIKNWIELELSDVRDYVRKKNRTWLIVAGVVVVSALALLFTVFKRKDSSKADKKIEVLQQQIDNMKRSNLFIDSLLREKDTLYIENRKTETKVITRYEQIPNTVRDLTRDELDRELSKYDY
jgi:Tfp pilus assembly protein PilN